jgi:hypothetical protein
MSYHLNKIIPGKLGEISKIREEFEELMDANVQGNPVMEMLELSDMLGAIECYIKKYNLTLTDLIIMKEATRRAFTDGTRKPKEVKT